MPKGDWQRNKTHCPKGHRYNESNTGRRKDNINFRYCLQCQKDRNTAPGRIEYARQYRQSEQGKATCRRLRLFRNFGLSVDEYNVLLKVQNNKCYTCQIDQSILGYNLCVDHDHLTMKIRGLLCRECNTVLGLIKENKNTLNRMINYLKGRRNDN